MSYMRGDNYIWSAGEQLHIWVADGYDGCDQAVWAADESEKRRKGRENASGVGNYEGVMDEFVMMRFAQMIEEGMVEEAIDRAVARSGGNFDCEVLAKKKKAVEAALGQIQLDSGGSKAA